MEFYWSKLTCLEETTLKIIGEKNKTDLEQRVMVWEQFRNPILKILRTSRH